MRTHLSRSSLLILCLYVSAALEPFCSIKRNAPMIIDSDLLPKRKRSKKNCNRLSLTSYTLKKTCFMTSYY